jgi:hypothetical protein
MRQEQKNFKYRQNIDGERGKTMNTYTELSRLIQKVSAMGIHVIEDGQRHTEKALSVIITKEKGIKEMMPCRFVRDDEVISGHSPFTWRL